MECILPATTPTSVLVYLLYGKECTSLRWSPSPIRNTNRHPPCFCGSTLLSIFMPWLNTFVSKTLDFFSSYSACNKCDEIMSQMGGGSDVTRGDEDVRGWGRNQRRSHDKSCRYVNDGQTMAASPGCPCPSKYLAYGEWAKQTTGTGDLQTVVSLSIAETSTLCKNSQALKSLWLGK